MKTNGWKRNKKYKATFGASIRKICNYYKYVFQFTGLTAPLKKAKKYNEINYDAVYKVIDDFCNAHNNKKSSANDTNRSK